MTNMQIRLIVNLKVSNFPDYSMEIFTGRTEWLTLQCYVLKQKGI